MWFKYSFEWECLRTKTLGKYNSAALHIKILLAHREGLSGDVRPYDFGSKLIDN